VALTLSVHLLQSSSQEEIRHRLLVIIKTNFSLKNLMV
jgi:hypothetical protein